MQAYPEPCGVKNAWGSYYNKQWWSYVQWWPYTVQITLNLLLLLNENQYHTSHEQIKRQSTVTLCPTRPHGSPWASCCPLLCMHNTLEGKRCPRVVFFLFPQLKFDTHDIQIAFLCACWVLGCTTFEKKAEYAKRESSYMGTVQIVVSDGLWGAAPFMPDFRPKTSLTSKRQNTRDFAFKPKN